MCVLRVRVEFYHSNFFSAKSLLLCVCIHTYLNIYFIFLYLFVQLLYLLIVLTFLYSVTLKLKKQRNKKNPTSDLYAQKEEYNGELHVDYQQSSSVHFSELLGLVNLLAVHHAYTSVRSLKSSCCCFYQSFLSSLCEDKHFKTLSTILVEPLICPSVLIYK